MAKRQRWHLADPFSPRTLCGRRREATEEDLPACKHCDREAASIRAAMADGVSRGWITVPCTVCHAPTGIPCLAAAGHATIAHVARLLLARLLRNGVADPTMLAELAIVLDAQVSARPRKLSRAEARRRGEIDYLAKQQRDEAGSPRIAIDDPKSASDGEASRVVNAPRTFRVTLSGVAIIQAQVEVEAADEEEARELAREPEIADDHWEWVEVDGSQVTVDAIEEVGP